MRWRVLFFYTLISFLKIQICIAEEDDLPSLEIECSDIEIFYSEKGIVKYKLEAKDIIKKKDESIELPNGGTLTCYDSEGRVEFKAHANAARGTADNMVWDFEGNVYVEANKVRLDSDRLHWDRADEILSTNDLVQIKSEDNVLVGEGLVAKQDLSYYKIAHPRGSMKMDEEG